MGAFQSPEAPTLSASSPSKPPKADGSPATTAKRRCGLRFGLRTLFVFAIGFCLFFAWIARNLYEARQDQAAIETIQRTGADFFLSSRIRWDEGPMGQDAEPQLAVWERVVVAMGLADGPKIRGVRLWIEQPDDPSAEATLRAMRRFPEIREVRFVGRGFDDETIATLKHLPNLETIDLMRTEVSGKGLASLAGGSNLTSLHVTSDGRVEGLGKGAAELETLTLVVLSRVRIERQDVAALATLPQLEQLLLLDVHLEDESDALLPLENARALKHLSVSFLRSEPDTLEKLPRIEGLEGLTLHGVTDETLANWPATPTLREALLEQPIMAETAREFSAAHPGCDVVHFSGSEVARYRAGEVVK